MKMRTALLFSSAVAMIFALLLSLVGVSPCEETTSIHDQTQTTMPEPLLGAFLLAASQPFEPVPEGFHARSGGLDFTLNASGLQTSGGDLSWGIVLSGIGRGLSFTSPNQQTLRYDHLRAWDAGGVPLDAKLVGAQNQVRLWINDQGAAYPITVDPLIYTEQKVTAPDGASVRSFWLLRWRSMGIPPWWERTSMISMERSTRARPTSSPAAGKHGACSRS